MQQGVCPEGFDFIVHSNGTSTWLGMSSKGEPISSMDRAGQNSDYIVYTIDPGDPMQEAVLMGRCQGQGDREVQ